jgi:hypothetical protein
MLSIPERAIAKPVTLRRPAGKPSDRSDEQPQNAAPEISEIWQPDSNVTFERAPQLLKQLEMISTDDGMQID